MTIATAAILLPFAAACGTGEPADGPADPPSATASAPTTGDVDPAAALVGDWHDPEVEWVVHFLEGDRFSVDFEGHEDFLVGSYEVEGDRVSLVGDDGNTDVGTIEGDSIVFNLGTLTRM